MKDGKSMVLELPVWPRQLRQSAVRMGTLIIPTLPPVIESGHLYISVQHYSVCAELYSL